MSNLTTCFAQNDGTDCKYGITNIKDEVYTNIKCRLNKVYIYLPMGICSVSTVHIEIA